MKKAKLLTAWLLAVCMLFSLVSFTAAEETSGVKFGSGIYSVESDIEQFLLADPDTPDVPTDIPLTQRRVAFYYMAEQVAQVEADLYFPENMPSVPYLEIHDAMILLFTMVGDPQKCDVLEFVDDTTMTYTRPDGSSLIFDFSENTITIYNYDQFLDFFGLPAPLDIAQYGSGDDNALLKHYLKLALPGNALRINLSDYGIHMMCYDGKVYIPLQTFNDLFVSPGLSNWAWNGEALFDVSPGLLVETTANGQSRLTALGKLYYAPERRGTRPEDLVMFTYRELCLALDVHYGLKSEHGIGNFNEYFIRSGLAVSLLSEDPAVFYQAICDLTELHFADNHSAIGLNSPFADPLRPPEANDGLDRTTDLFVRYGHYTQLRTTVTGSDKGPEGYVEYGDTAFITFDSFIFNYNIDYSTCELVNDPNDTVMLILYAHQQITRKNSPIRYVVIDLSCNTGGTADAAAIVIAWFLSSGTVQVESTLTHEKNIVMYRLDANRDGKIDENDQLPGYIGKFCITSGASFSCGNLVPAVFRASDEVILLGRKSGGGTCEVQPLTTADGLLFQCSSNRRLSVATNGSFSSVDEGIQPDFVLADMSMVYRREEMVEYIHGLQ